MADAWVDLADAIEGLRAALTEAIDRRQAKVHPCCRRPVELTLEAAVTYDGHGQVGWKILEFGGSRESSTTQTLKLSLTPVWQTAEGAVVADPLVSTVVPGPASRSEGTLGAHRGAPSAPQSGTESLPGRDEEDDD
jgi:hypothetical protein